MIKLPNETGFGAGKETSKGRGRLVEMNMGSVQAIKPMWKQSERWKAKPDGAASFICDASFAITSFYPKSPITSAGKDDVTYKVSCFNMGLEGVYFLYIGIAQGQMRN